MDKPYTFTPGEYLTRDGRKAVVLCTDAPGGFPLIGFIPSIKGNDVVIPMAWDEKGSVSGGLGGEGVDLMPPAPAAPEAVVRWVNHYHGKDGRAHLTLKEAVRGSRDFNGNEAAIARTRVTFTPGQFDTDDTPSEWDQAIDEAVRILTRVWAAASDADFPSRTAGNLTADLRALKRGNGHA